MSSGKAPVLNTGYKLPGIGYGTWQAKEGEAEAGIFEALRIGYRHLDLAKVYRNQVEIGKAIKRSLAEIPGLKREDIFITSKLWNNKHDPKDVEPALDETLAELGLDYLDLYLIHWPVAFTPSDNLFPKKNDNEMGLSPTITITDTWKAMIALPKSKVRSVGVSNFNIDHIEAIIEETGVVPAVNQIERHPLLPNLPLIEYCAKKHIVITAYSAFGNNDVGAPLLVNSPEIKAIAEKLSQKQGKTVTAAQVILAWSQIGGHTVIPKSIKPERIQENFNEVELDEEAIAAVNKIGENPRRYNLPINYAPKWDINLFNLPDEQAASTKVLLK